MTSEKEMRGFSGWFMLFALIAVLLGATYMVVQAARVAEPWGIVGWLLVIVLSACSCAGLTVVNPNESKVVQLAGVYKGTIKHQGFWWVNPLTSRRKLSLRIRNFESGHLKVNDHDGNPIEIAAVVVWRIVETYEALFNVNDYEHFVHVQSEAALRNLAVGHPYDAHNAGQMSRRGNTLEVAEQLKKEIQARLEKAGIEVIEARISHLAYAPEIANAMLRRQQASAVIAARTKIVEGAVSMVEMALDELNKRAIVNLDEERKAAMVSNLLVVLCSEHETQPVVNAGTLYQ